MEHLPTWTVALVAVPVLVVAFAHRHGRASFAAALLAAGAALTGVVVAAAWFPGEVLGGLRIMLPLGVFLVALLGGCALLEALLAKVSGLASRRGHVRLPRPQPAAPRRVATGTWRS